tara:strand:- start:148 stop:360 length:213 start_codon:yes stop_codon:yes gene_type:complete
MKRDLSPKEVSNLQKALKESHKALTFILDSTNDIINSGGYDTEKIAYINKTSYEVLRKINLYCKIDGDNK